nr:hypothetical protein [Desulfopila sp. IMCC35008]
MTSLIYRPYWLDNTPFAFPVLGDISLNEEYRGTGLADHFFSYISKQIKSKKCPCALVIPNEAARKVLGRCGWNEREKLVHHVLLLNPEKKFLALVKPKLFSQILSSFYRIFLAARLKTIPGSELSLNIIEHFDEEFNVFWKALEKQDFCLRDRSKKSLNWRYGEYPADKTFFIATCHVRETLCGYLVYVINDESSTIIIYEVITLQEKYLPGFIKRFINYLQKNGKFTSIRIVTNEYHPYAKKLKRIGFAPRKGEQSIQVFIPDHPEVPLNKCRWFLTAGDKDV